MSGAAVVAAVFLFALVGSRSFAASGAHLSVPIASYDYDTPTDAVSSAQGTADTRTTGATGVVIDTRDAALAPASTVAGDSRWLTSSFSGFRAAKDEAELLTEARAAREAKAAEVGSSNATVTGGYDL